MADQSWTATVDFIWPTQPGIDEFSHWIDTLEGRSPAIGYQELADGTVLCQAAITYDAATVRKAVDTALRLVETATGAKAAGLDVLTTTEFDRRQAEPQIPPLVSLTDIAHKLNVSKQRITQLAERPDFPPVVARTASGPLRLESAVDAFAAKDWRRKPGPKPKPKPKSASST